MNNPPGNGNRAPQQGDDDGGINYFSLLPFLGIAVYRYCWVKHSEKEIEKIKIKHAMDLEKKEEALKKKDQEQTALVALKKVEDKLIERQYVYCSPFAFRNRRLEIEQDLHQLAKDPIFAHLDMENGLRDIFQNDHSCADRFNRNYRINGDQMWKHLTDWKKQLIPQTNQRKEDDLIENFKKMLSRLNP